MESQGLSKGARRLDSAQGRLWGGGFCRPYGTRFHFLRLTQDLRPGLSSAAPPGLGLRHE
jgi:hypothetical protein